VRALAVGLAAVVGAAAGCGSSVKSLPPACSDGPAAIVRALAAAPAAVRLSDGTQLSDCVASAYDDGEVQQLGFSFTPAAERLAARRTPAAALQLGYLVGAVHRGAARTNGVQGELVRRIEATITFADPALLAAARRGVRAGEARG
jgi:hypothetical protein